MGTTISGATGIDKVQDGTIVNADINSSAAIAGTKLVMPAGSVLQVVSVTKSDTSTMNGNTAWTDVPSLTVNITPSATSSKILVVASITLASGNHAHPRMLRGSTAIGNGVSAGSRPGVFGYANNPGGVNSATSNTYNYLDSPNTTSSTTYKIQLNNSNGSGACYINRTQDDANGVYSGRGVSSITLLEIGA